MPVPQLQWNVLGPIDTVSGSTSLNGILRTVDLLMSHSAYWQMTALDTTGSLAVAAVLSPRSGTTDVSDMRVIITGDLLTIPSSSFAPRTTGIPETHVSNNVYIGISPSTTASYVQGHYNSDSPLQGAAWSGYWSIGDRTDRSNVVMIESQESIWLFMREPGVNEIVGGAAGVLWAGYDGGSSLDGRIYGMIVTGDTSISSAFLGLTTSFLSHGTTANVQHAGCFYIVDGVLSSSISTVTPAATFTSTPDYPGPLFTTNNTLTGLPLHYISNGGAGATRAIGFLRQIYAAQDMYAPAVGLIVSASISSADSNVVGAYLSPSTTATSDAILFISSGTYGV